MNDKPTQVQSCGRRRVLHAVCALALTVGLPGLVHADLVGILPHIKPSIVAVGTYQRTRSPAFQFRGTGFVIGDGFLIATNAHVLPDAVASENRETLVIVVPGEGEQGTVRAVRKLADERSRDLALLRLESGAALPALTLAARERAGAKPASMEEAMPEIYKELDALQTKLENHYKDMQDMEFTVQEGKLWFLQTRNGKRTGNLFRL